MEQQEIRVRIVDPQSGNRAEGKIRVRYWNRRERVLRALKFGGLCWGAALVSVLLPLLHFVLVPSFLLAGPIVGYFILVQTSVVLGGEGVCPGCQAQLPIIRAPDRFPISDVCARCCRGLKVEPVDS